MQTELTTHIFRLFPGDDLRTSIENFVRENNIEAGWIASCIGSLTNYSIRFANKSEAAKGNGYFEILSCMGTVSVNGSHLHISISDDDGNTIGGHLMEGCKIYTTTEIIILQSKDFTLTRVKDENTGWNELQVKHH